MVLPAIALLGFAVLIIGSMGYMGVYKVADVLSYILMVIGLLTVIVCLAIMLYQTKVTKDTP